MSFYDELEQLDFDYWHRRVMQSTENDVADAFMHEQRTVEDFAALLSPAAVPLLPEMIREAEKLTRKRFGQTLGMYIPLYLTNLCSNSCKYCGFAAENKFRRKVLNREEVIAECEAIAAMGYETILVVTGEHQRKGGMDYFREMIPIVKKYSTYLMMEVQPMDTEDYRELKGMGVDAVMVYQETYHKPT